MPVERRREVVSGLGYCFNCLARSHSQNHCTSEEACRRCDQMHHTLLHIPSRREQLEELAVVRATSSRQHQQTRSRRPAPPQRQQPVRQRQQPQSTQHCRNSPAPQRRTRQQQCRTRPSHQRRAQRQGTQQQQPRWSRQQQQHRQQARNRQQQQHRQQARNRQRPTPSADSELQPTTVTAPDQRKLIAAIKSIAEVLCTE